MARFGMHLYTSWQCLQVHRVSVRCNSNMGQSADSQCTMLVGKGQSNHLKCPYNPIYSHWQCTIWHSKFSG